MKILFTFPGQGTQRAGMLQHLPDSDAVLNSVRAVLGDETDRLDSTDALRHTRAVQLSLSIGAFPAAVISGALDFSDALRLVALRGDLMEQAYPQGYGLTAITGLTLSRLEKLLAGSNTYIANLNAETQIVIAGRDEDMAVVAQKALDAGASKAVKLAVSVPSHCALLDKPAAELARAFESVSLSRPDCAYLSGSTGRVIWEPEKIADDLAFNMARTVQWNDAMVSANQRDARLAIEMPPGNVLTGLTLQAGWQGEAICLERNSIDVALHLAKRLSQ
jgi:malonate decarboxylase epsilon subunit